MSADDWILIMYITIAGALALVVAYSDMPGGLCG